MKIERFFALISSSISLFSEDVEYFLIWEKARFEMTSSNGQTLLEMKESIQKITGVPVGRQRLIFAKRTLKDDNATLKDLGITNGSKVMLIGSKEIIENLPEIPADVEPPAPEERSESKSEENTEEKIGENPEENPGVTSHPEDLNQPISAAEEKMLHQITDLLLKVEELQDPIEEFQTFSAARSVVIQLGEESEEEVKNLRKKIKERHAYLAEQLEKLNLTLDAITCQEGHIYARKKRKQAVARIQTLLHRLDTIYQKFQEGN